MTLKYVSLLTGALLFAITATAATPDRRCLKICGEYEATFMMERNFLRETLNLSCDIKGTEDGSHDFQKADSGIDGIQFAPAQADGTCRAQISIGGGVFTAVLKSATDFGHFVLQTENPSNETIVFRKLDGQSAPVTPAVAPIAMISGSVAAGTSGCSGGVVQVAVYDGGAVIQQASVVTGSAFTFQLTAGTYTVSAQSVEGCVAQQQVTLAQGQSSAVNLALAPSATYPYGYGYPGTYPYPGAYFYPGTRPF